LLDDFAGADRDRVGPRDRATWAALSRLLKGDDRGESHVSHFVQAEVLTKLCRYATRRQVPQGHAVRGLIDYTIQCSGGCVIWVEVKRLGLSLHPEMIEKYMLPAADLHRVAIGVLTNGTEWEFWCGGKSAKELGIVPFRFRRIDLTSLDDVVELRLTLGSTVVFRRLLEGVLEHRPALVALLQRPRVHAAYEGEYRKMFTGAPPRLRSVFLTRDGRVDPRLAAARLALTRNMARVLRGELKRVFGREPARLAVRTALDDLDLRPWAL
jgi:hypothetical protein